MPARQPARGAAGSSVYTPDRQSTVADSGEIPFLLDPAEHTWIYNPEVIPTRSNPYSAAAEVTRQVVAAALRSYGDRLADGPKDRLRFAYGGREVDLSDKPMRHQLLAALWDEAERCPHRERAVTDVMAELWPGEDDADGKFKNLCSQVRRDLVAARIGLTVRTAAGRVWLEKLPD